MTPQPSEVVNAFLQTPNTNVVAIGAVVSPFWMPYLQTSSDVASLLLPIAGLAWLFIQMVVLLRKKK